MKFWGVRGSIPSPGSETSRYGGNTPCVEVRCGRELLIFDLGSGVRSLGEHERSPFKATIFISHYHYDHLQGLPFFRPIFEEQNTFVIYGPTRKGLSVKQALEGQMQEPYFPVSAQAAFRAKVTYHAFHEGLSVTVGAAKVTGLELNHPGGNLGYRVDFRGRSLVYATDVEPGSGDMDARVAAFAHRADVLIYDAMYTDEEYFGHRGVSKAGWGHSTWRAAVSAARRCEAARLVLFHHEPTRSDDDLDALARLARVELRGAVVARESQVLQL